ncbi:phosphorylase family protein [Microbacterium resistens]|uniref:phosphorylase family protein n=1 Tax=Microbacterium resistens TaxID=156977 RepID=UPI000A016B3C|nr:phosphorylase [Microbacterium resistens]
MTSSSSRSAADPWLDGRPPHIPADGSPLPPVCLLPGDPARVSMSAPLFDEFEIIGSRREFTLGVGRYRGASVAVCSTGIGGPSTEIALIELHRLGVGTFIRVGGMGATSPDIEPGAITSVRRTFRDGGAARFYDDGTAPVDVDPAVAAALDVAAERRGERLTSVSVLSCDSYYVGEGRPVPGFEEAAQRRLAAAEQLGAEAMDMECETVYVIARALGARYGALLAAHGNRATDEWLEDYEPVQVRLLRIALDASVALTAGARGGTPG